MKIVLDTNVLLVSISSKSRYRPIFDAFINESYELFVTTDILLEYEEIIKEHMGDRIAEYVLQLIENNRIVIPYKMQAALKLKDNASERVIVLIDDADYEEDVSFKQATQNQFLEGYSESDSVYDNM